MNKKYGILFVFFAVLFVFLVSNVFLRKNDTVKTDFVFKDVSFGDVTVHTEIVDTDEKRRKGLSGRDNLKDGEGMLFIYDVPGIYGFWMPNMNFSIDIIWISEDLKIVYVKENATPESYPEVFASGKPAMYVLEVPAFFVRDNGIKIGDVVSFL